MFEERSSHLFFLAKKKVIVNHSVRKIIESGMRAENVYIKKKAQIIRKGALHKLIKQV